jgi:hypothetical protein
VHHDVDVVEQDPSTGPLTLTPHRLGLFRQVGQLLLDRVDDGLHLPLVGRGGEHEGVGDDQLVTHVDDDDVLRLLVGGGLGGGERQLSGALGCSHPTSLSYPRGPRRALKRTNYR